MSFTDRSFLLRFAFWKEPELYGQNYGIGVHDIDRNGELDFFANHHLNKLEAIDYGEIVMNFMSISPYIINFPNVANGLSADTHGVTFFDIDQDGDVDLLQAVGSKSGTATDPSDVTTWNQINLNNNGIISTNNSAEDFGLQYALGRGRLLFPINLDGQIAVYVGVRERIDGINPGQLFLREGTGRYVEHEPIGTDLTGWMVTGIHLGVDRFTDLINVRPDKSVIIHTNNGSGFESGVSLLRDATDLITGDFNGDLVTDVIVGHAFTDTIYFDVSGGGWSEFAESLLVERSLGADPVLARGDFDNDGDLDYVAFLNRDGVDLRIYLNRGDGTFEQEARFWDPNIEGRASFMISGDSIATVRWT